MKPTKEQREGDYSEIVFLDENNELIYKIQKVFAEIQKNHKLTKTQEHARLNKYLRNALNQARIIRDYL